jgi:glycyl-tRNA synthetase
VIEPSGGVDRATLAFICDAYEEVPGGRGSAGAEVEVVLRLHPRLAPLKAAVLPLVKRDGMPGKAQAIHADLRKWFPVEYDEAGSIGRRYRRQDEVGTPWCITVDSETMEDDTVTIRDRDTMQQERVAASKLALYLREKLEGW